jgi:hypothetical protein
MKLELCDKRKAIIAQAGHLLVLGGPGSGKTTRPFSPFILCSSERRGNRTSHELKSRVLMPFFAGLSGSRRSSGSTVIGLKIDWRGVDCNGVPLATIRVCETAECRFQIRVSSFLDGEVRNSWKVEQIDLRQKYPQLFNERRLKADCKLRR